MKTHRRRLSRQLSQKLSNTVNEFYCCGPKIFISTLHASVFQKWALKGREMFSKFLVKNFLEFKAQITSDLKTDTFRKLWECDIFFRQKLHTSHIQWGLFSDAYRKEMELFIYFTQSLDTKADKAKVDLHWREVLVRRVKTRTVPEGLSPSLYREKNQRKSQIKEWRQKEGESGRALKI